MSQDHLERRDCVFVSVSPEVIDPTEMLRLVSDARAGCTVLFTGTVRNHSPGRDDVSKLEYEAYGSVAEDKIRGIVEDAMDQWPLMRVSAVHRTGTLSIGESAVMVAVSSAHRTEAFPAARYIIDELKARAPIWKKEHWPGGAEWVDESQKEPTAISNQPEE